MNIEKTSENGKLTVKVSGRLDSLTAPELEAALGDVLGGVKELEFDFSSLDYLSSAGLRVLLAAQKVMDRQGKMSIHNACETIKEVFEITGFINILTVV